MEPSRSSTSCGEFASWGSRSFLSSSATLLLFISIDRFLVPSIAKGNASSVPLSGLPLYGETGAWLGYRGKFNRKRGIQRIFDASTAVAAFLILESQWHGRGLCLRTRSFAPPAKL